MRGRALTMLVVIAANVASARADRIVVESYVENRPVEADRILAPLRSALERHGFVVEHAALAKRFAAHTWRSGGNRSVGPAMFKKIEDGAREFADAKVTAVGTLKSGIDLARANPVAWVNEPKFRDQVPRGLLTYALAINLRAKEARDRASRAKGKSKTELEDRASADEQARDETIDDLLRNFPQFVVDPNVYGARAEALFQEASKRARQNGGASIDLDVDDPNVIVYVDESQQPRKTTVGNIIGGRHRVLVVGASESREYSVDVLPNRRSRVVVKWGLDSVLKIGPWAGFTFPSDGERQHEGEMLAALLGTSGAVDIAATLTVRADGGGVVGHGYDMRLGRAPWTCSYVASRNVDADAAEQFARCLAADRDDKRTVISGHDGPSEPTKTPPRTVAVRPTTAAPAVATKQGDPGTEANEGVEDASEDRESSHRWMLWTAVGSFGVSAISGALAVKFVLDGNSAGDEYDRVCAVMCTGEQAKAIISKKDEANQRAWVAGGVSGAAVIGGVVMSILWHRNEAASSTPTAQLVPGGATMGWTVRF